MKTKPLPVGVDDFEQLITNGYYYVDKTLLLKELLDKKGEVNLFTRPRRFGKSLNMSMLRYFFENGRDHVGNQVEHKGLFEGLAIMQAGEAYLYHMGKYPVIMLSLKSAKQEDFAQAFAALKEEIAGEFGRHSYILKSDTMAGHVREKYTAIMEGKAERSDYNTSLKFLSKCLRDYYGQKVIIMIDEYDVPLESAYIYHYYTQMISFVRSLFESAMKTNLNLEFAVLTGCLRISKESVFTGMNNLKIISVLSKNYDEYFGFTNWEVQQLCVDYGIPEKYDVIKEWYDGYVFGNADVYNPWSVILYVEALVADLNELPSSYWANTSSNSIVRSLIERADRNVKDEIEEVIEGKAVEKPVHEDIIYDEIYESMDNLWNFMFFTGYFRKVGERMEAGQKYITLTIPNEEVRYIFRNKVLGWFREEVRKRDQTKLFGAFLHLDAAMLRDEIEDMLWTTISFNDYYESFYHGFLAGILYGMDGYVVKSNREGGTGRTDLFIRPASRRKTAYVVEFKVAQKYEDLDKKAEEALEQIEDKAYERELRDDGYASIVRYGIAFFGKNCEVKVRGRETNESVESEKQRKA